MARRGRQIGLAMVAGVALAAAAAAEFPAVRLNFGPPDAAACPGWLAWSVPTGDAAGPLVRRVPPTLLDPDGFEATLGPAQALGCRRAPGCTGPAAAVIQASVFAPAQTPMVLTISGLRPGRYRMVLWLNDARGYAWPPVQVLVTDAAGAGRVALKDQPQTAVTDSARAARSEVDVEVGEATAVVLTLSVPPAAKTYVFLSGLEIVSRKPPTAVDLQAVLTARSPTPALGALDSAPDTVLSWWGAVADPSWDVWVGPTPAGLRQAATGLTTRAWQGHFAAREEVFWRVDGRLGDQVVQGPVWHFTCGSTMRIDDFEDYGGGQRLSDSWDDERARQPGRGPLLELSADGRNAMVLRHPGGEVVVRRALADHSDWICGGVTHLAVEQRWEATGPAPAISLRLTDAAGQTAEAALSEAEGGASTGGG